MERFAVVQCRFSARYPAVGGWEYRPVVVRSYDRDGCLHTMHPPAVGDSIVLYDPDRHDDGLFRVVNRLWSHAAWGSSVWPITDPQPSQGPALHLVVEACEGQFVDEVTTPDE